MCTFFNRIFTHRTHELKHVSTEDLIPFFFELKLCGTVFVYSFDRTKQSIYIYVALLPDGLRQSLMKQGLTHPCLGPTLRMVPQLRQQPRPE